MTTQGSFLLCSALLVLAACRQESPAPDARPDASTGQPAAAKPRFSTREWTIEQRRRERLADGRTAIQLGDITGGRVEVTVFDDGRLAAGPQFLAPEEALEFTLDGLVYRLELVALDNRLVGTDRARLRVGPVESPAQSDPGAQPDPAAERRRIEALLEAVRDANVRFERAGTMYDGRAAAEHLRMKLDYAGDRIRSAEEFIEHIGSRSSLSGKPYYIIDEDGRRIAAGTWLRQRLAAIDERSR